MGLTFSSGCHSQKEVNNQDMTLPQNSTPRKLSDFKGDRKWRSLSQWGKELGVLSWTSSVVSMPSIHPNILMGSRLSVQELIDGNEVTDQFRTDYRMSDLVFLCAASSKTCEYCEYTDRARAFHLRDRHEHDSAFLELAVRAAQRLRTMLSKRERVLVHCHSGRNRSALVILIYAAMYTDLEYEQAVSYIKDYNASRFPRASTLKNTSFTRMVSANWGSMRSLLVEPSKHRKTAYGFF